MNTVIKWILLGVIAMVLFEYTSMVIPIFSEEDFEKSMSLIHFAFLIGIPILLLTTLVLILTNWNSDPNA